MQKVPKRNILKTNRPTKQITNVLRLSVAIPDSSLSDESTKVDKTRKISVLARACAIFSAETIYVYGEGGDKEDKSLLITILRYLETPQFLRKKLFPKMNELKFAGVLHPLKIPSHVTAIDPKKIIAGNTRDGIIVKNKGKKYVDVGIGQMIEYFGKSQAGRRITVMFKEGWPKLAIKEISKYGTTQYGGYTVKERASLHSLLKEWEGNTIITSRRGKTVTSEQITRYTGQDKPVLVVFGSPDRGIHDILGSNMRQIQNAKILNFFNGQATQTVRLEEALLGTLSIINAYSTTSQTTKGA